MKESEISVINDPVHVIISCIKLLVDNGTINESGKFGLDFNIRIEGEGKFAVSDISLKCLTSSAEWNT